MVHRILITVIYNHHSITVCHPPLVHCLYFSRFLSFICCFMNKTFCVYKAHRFLFPSLCYASSYATCNKDDEAGAFVMKESTVKRINCVTYIQARRTWKYSLLITEKLWHESFSSKKYRYCSCICVNTTPGQLSVASIKYYCKQKRFV